MAHRGPGASTNGHCRAMTSALCREYGVPPGSASHLANSMDSYPRRFRDAKAAVATISDVYERTTLDDRIANGTDTPSLHEPKPLSLFSAPRIDLSLMRLKHYSGTSARHFQNFVIFTNYQFYMDEFVRLAHTVLAGGDAGPLGSGYTALVEPGDVVTLAQGVTHD